MEEKTTVREKQHRGRHTERRKKSSTRTIISNVILVIAVAVFLFSGYKLFTIYSEYGKGEKEYENVLEAVVIEQQDPNEEDENEQEVIFKVDFDKLRSLNSEAVAWIRFDNPSKISYPVVQGSDNAKYLNTTFEGKKNGAGALFVDADNTSDFSDRNTFIYGHNMKNGSMFGQLRKYKTKSFCEKNPYFYIYTPDGKQSKYQVFATCIVEDTSDSYRKFYSGDKDFEEYLTQIRGCALYDTDVSVTANSQIVSLSTCTNVTETQRLLVHGVKVEETVPTEETEPAEDAAETTPEDKADSEKSEE